MIGVFLSADHCHSLASDAAYMHASSCAQFLKLSIASSTYDMCVRLEHCDIISDYRLDYIETYYQ